MRRQREMEKERVERQKAGHPLTCTLEGRPRQQSRQLRLQRGEGVCVLRGEEGRIWWKR